jgi:hypothetical protein
MPAYLTYVITTSEYDIYIYENRKLSEIVESESFLTQKVWKAILKSAIST